MHGKSFHILSYHLYGDSEHSIPNISRGGFNPANFLPESWLEAGKSKCYDLTKGCTCRVLVFHEAIFPSAHSMSSSVDNISYAHLACVQLQIRSREHIGREENTQHLLFLQRD